MQLPSCLVLLLSGSLVIQTFIKGEIMMAGQVLMHQDVCDFVIAVNDWILVVFLWQ